MLEVSFFEEEIYKEIKGVDGNKAPGLDGFTFRFTQMCWPELKGKLTSLFDYSFETTDFDSRFSSSFNSLLPKVYNPTSLNDFRPMSLLGWVHKLVT